MNYEACPRYNTSKPCCGRSHETDRQHLARRKTTLTFVDGHTIEVDIYSLSEVYDEGSNWETIAWEHPDTLVDPKLLKKASVHLVRGIHPTTLFTTKLSDCPMRQQE